MVDVFFSYNKCRIDQKEMGSREYFNSDQLLPALRQTTRNGRRGAALRNE